MQTRPDAIRAPRPDDVAGQAHAPTLTLEPARRWMPVAGSRSAWVELCWQAGTTLLFMVAAVSGLAALLLLCGGALGRIEASLILVAAAGATAALSRTTYPDGWRWAWGSALIIAFVAVAASRAMYDTSIDGQFYHFQAISALTHGWNPYWSAEAPTVLGQKASLWSLHYPKAAWLFDATLVAAGLPLEATKAVNVMMPAAAGLMLAGALGKLELSWPALAALTVTAALNPIAGVQLVTRMNDGLIASCVLAFFAAAAVWIARDDRKAFFAAAAAMMFAVNLKFSALPLFALFCAAAVGAMLVLKGWRKALEAALALLVAGLAGVLVFGWSPYVVNLWYFDHPFYPLMGSGAADIMTDNTPEFMTSMTGLERLAFSLFASTHSGYETIPSLKLPLWLSLSEIRTSGGPDVRIGGFGPLFSAVIVAAGVVVALLLATRERARHLRWLLYVAAVISLSVIVMPESWWARYVPQLWLLPWIAVLAALLTKDRAARIAGWVTVALMLADTLLVTGAATALALRRSQAVSEQLAALKRAPGPYCVDAELVQSRVAVMQEAGVDARLVAKGAPLTCAEPQAIAAYGPDRQGGRICPCAAN